jgi:hypothetical protein
MNALDKAFAFFATSPPPVGYMDATLTGTRIPGLPAFIATASGALVTYVPGSTETISFDASLLYQHPVGSGGAVHVTLEKTGSGYRMIIVLPARTVNSAANVDAASGVVYGSQGVQFVTLVLKVGPQG